LNFGKAKTHVDGRSAASRLIIPAESGGEFFTRQNGRQKIGSPQITSSARKKKKNVLMRSARERRKNG